RAAFPYDEMMIVLGGVLRVRTEDDGELVVHPGEVVHLPANSTNEFVAEEEVTACYVAGPPDVYARHADDPASHRWEPQPASRGTGTPDEAAVRRALDSDVLVDITTTGRRSGLPRRLEIWLYRSGGRFFLTGYPEDRPRDWYRNLLADPRLTVHLKESVVVDLPATAVEVTDAVDRRRVLDDILDQLSRPDNPQGLSEELDRAGWQARSPLLEITGLTG
ncbi:nitroreductase/quinone reductase family protein, partial [Actinoalloteichus caeruleus]